MTVQDGVYGPSSQSSRIFVMFEGLVPRYRSYLCAHGPEFQVNVSAEVDWLVAPGDGEASCGVSGGRGTNAVVSFDGPRLNHFLLK
jgi:hypothetical protein